MPRTVSKASKLTQAERSASAAIGANARADGMQARREEAAAALLPLIEPADALTRLECISRLAVGGILPGAQASAASRAVEAWLQAHRLNVSVQHVRALEQRIKELERELALSRQRTS